MSHSSSSQHAEPAVADALPGSARSTRTSWFARPVVRYIGIRGFVSAVLLLGVTVVTFILTNLVPVSPITAALGEQAASDPATVAKFVHDAGLDKPAIVQYFVYLGKLLHGDLGTSIQTRNPVTQDLGQAFPATAELALCVITISIILGLGLGLIAAVRKDRFSDQLIRMVSLIGISVPTFWLAAAIYFLFFFVLRWAPGSGRLSPAATPPPRVTGMYTIDSLLSGQFTTFLDAATHLALPTLTLTLFTVGMLVRFSRTAILDVLNQDYVRAARAKGLTTNRVLFGYVVRGSIAPILTIVGLAFGSLLSGTVLTEQVFAWGGLGQYAYRASTALDLPSVMGVGLLVGAIYIITNFIIDVVYGFVDPRVRIG